MSKTIIEKFQATADHIKDKKIAILATAVDPDAVASALALKYILEQTNPDQYAHIFYGGSIDHEQSRTMFNRYDLESKMSSCSRFKSENYDHIALVDSSKVIDSRFEGMTGAMPIIVIDHHHDGTVTDSTDSFIWIENANATATLIVELLQKLKLTPPHYIAVLLGLAIYTDTKAFGKASGREYAALHWLTKTEGVAESLGKLITYPRPKSYLEHEKNAYASFIQKDTKVVTNLGYISSDDGSTIAAIADKFVAVTGISIVVSFAIVDEAFVRLSIRSDDISASMSKIVEKFGSASGFKISSEGEGEGGARIEFNLAPWYISQTKAEALALIRKYIEYQVLGE